MTVVYTVDDIDPSCTKFALFSGGNDSVVSTHLAYKKHEIDWTVYLDTNTGVPANTEHVKDVCDQYGWDLAILSSPYTLREFALGGDDRTPLGFPGPGAHSWAYNMFKERQLGYLATRLDERPTYYCGMRMYESDRRRHLMKGSTNEEARWTWVSPVHDWRDSAMDKYRREHDLPTNPVAEKIGRSGDCYCGAYAHRDTELAELEAHYPKHADWLKDLEEDVQEIHGTDEGRWYWGFGGLSEKELRAKMAADDMDQMALCSSCDVPSTPWSDD